MYPSERVVIAMIESYLSMRVPTWNVKDEDGKLSTPENDSDQAAKMETCKTLLENFRHLNGKLFLTDDWIKFVNTLHTEELKERTNLDKRGILRRWVGSELLLETLKAIRSYVLTELSTGNAEYSSHIENLKRLKNEAGMLYTSRKDLKATNKPEEIVAAENAYKAATSALEPFDLDGIKHEQKDHLHYFEKYTVKYDPQAKITALHEKSFAEFANHAREYKRETVLSDKLVGGVSFQVDSKGSNGKQIPISVVPTKQGDKTDIKTLEEAAATSPNPVVQKAPKSAPRSRLATQKKSSTKTTALRANSAVKSSGVTTRAQAAASKNLHDDDDSYSPPSNGYRKY